MFFAINKSFYGITNWKYGLKILQSKTSTKNILKNKIFKCITV